MPLKDDLVTRMMERIEQIILTVTALKEESRFDEALAEIEGTTRESTGSGLDVIHLLPSEGLVDLLSSAGTINAERCLLIAELLRLEEGVREARGEAASPARLLKAFDLLLEALLAEEALLPAYSSRVAPLYAKLEAFELPPQTERRMFEFAALRGDFAEAENRLFSLLQTCGPDAELLARGRRFYRALLEQSDATLEAGGLPRDEVREGLHGLEGYEYYE